ncbi:aminopeptidase [Basidiobolus meristosporus CBS 931.73]|uniref:Aminopeptidase n=1 Tax=Basidiobolus meristosporus CBS 931.73 TaxID=1314790 RepID=A0A1Y1Z351_9FUNG|nr:aminopeptidase [Basidiobolus meristosporus CBS 931.73]|eukprot:ORY04712.1 aminopeptidase [Basidiobolus meristosporus CBS 931.73]
MATADRIILPTNVKPSHYVVSLTPDLEKFTFEGSVDTTLTINENTSKITLHAKEIKVHSAYLNSEVSKTEQNNVSTDISYDEKLETVTLTFPQEVPAGSQALLSLKFSGILNDKMSGFYRSSYNDKDGNKKYMAVTQFEATDARKAFPCWDEPALKATFDITLRVPEELTALSNTDVISESKVGGLKEVKFSTTPIMSTYLVAFVVGDLEYIEASTSGINNGKPVVCRIYTLKGQSSQGHFALDVATKTLEYFSEAFGSPYPLPKLDLIAIPDFEAGAMENWGLVTFRTVLLLFDEKTSSARIKLRIANVVAHELAHQWFGNLVTMEWWNHLWLNEGFATWVASLAVNKLFPDWNVWTQFVVDDLQRGLQLDALRSSHPIEVDVRDPAEIHQIFDAISYSKGASVIRMLSSFLGEDVFLRGVRAYLKKHEYGNASTQDLWNSLSEESGHDVGKFMTLWTKQVGYPVLTVTEADGKLNIRQSRYLSSGDVTPADDTQLWWVPLSITDASNVEKSSDDILTDKEASFDIPKNGFYKLNSQQTGVYRVHYPTEALEKLGEAVQQKQGLTASDRIGIVADTAALAYSGFSKTSDLLSLLKHFENEDDYTVLSEIAGRIRTLVSVWYQEPEEIVNSILTIQRNIFAKQAKRLGWEIPEKEDYLSSLLRNLAIAMAGKAEDKEIIAEAQQRFEKFIGGDESAIHPNLRSTVYDIVVKNGGQQEYEAVLKIYEETTTADQKLFALAALGSTSQPELIQRSLDFAISDSVRPQDIIYIISSIGSNPIGREPLWKFVSDHWDILCDRYAGSMATLGNIVKYSTGDFAEDAKAKEVEEFFKDKNTKDIDRPLQQSLEKLRANAAWLNRSREDVEKWLKENSN